MRFQLHEKISSINNGEASSVSQTLHRSWTLKALMRSVHKKKTISTAESLTDYLPFSRASDNTSDIKNDSIRYSKKIRTIVRGI